MDSAKLSEDDIKLALTLGNKDLKWIFTKSTIANESFHDTNNIKQEEAFYSKNMYKLKQNKAFKSSEFQKVVGNKAKGQISKQVFQENKAHQIFWKMNISYPLTCTCTFAYQGEEMFVF